MYTRMSIVRGERNTGCLESPRILDFVDGDSLEYMIAYGRGYDQLFLLVRTVYMILF